MTTNNLRVARLASAPLILFAIVTTPTTQAADVYVTAQRFAASIDTAPVNMTILTEEDIEKSGASDIAGVLNTEANIHVRDLFGAGAKTSVDMGGFGATGSQNALILLNGRRLNDVDLSGANLSLIPLGSVARIEIMHGNGTVLYGDNAVGGVINIVTKTGLDSTQSSAAISFGSFDTKRAEMLARGKAGNSGWMLSGDARGSDGYRNNSGVEQGSLAGEWTTQRGESLWGARFDAAKEDLELPGRLDEDTYRSNPETSSTSSIEHSNQDQFGIEGFLAGQTYSGELSFRQKDQHSQLFGTTDATLKSLSFTPRTRRTYNAHQIVAGVDLYQSDLETRADFATSGSLNTSEATRDAYAIYLSDTISFATHSAVQIGWRSQRVSLDVRNRDEITSIETPMERADDLEGWDVAYRYAPSKRWNAHVRAARSFRAPVLDEIWSYFGGGISLLDPQRGDHLEIGGRMQLNPAVAVDVTLSRVDNEREIGFDQTTFANVNLDPTRHDSLSIGYTNKIAQGTRVRASYVYHDASFREGANQGKTLPEVAKSQASLNVDHVLNAELTVMLGVRYVGKRYFGDDFANVGKTMDSYTWLNAGIETRDGPWKARIMVDNLLDEKTADLGYYNSFTANPYYYYPLPERSYTLRISRDW